MATDPRVQIHFSAEVPMLSADADVDTVMTTLGAKHPVDRNAILNDLGDVLIKHYGSIPLDVRYGAAEAPVRIVEQDREEWRRFIRWNPEQHGRALSDG